MVNYILSYLTLAIIFIFQTTLSKYIDIFSVAPNIICVFTLCYSMYNFPVRSTVLCVVAGLITDMYSHSYIGLNALLYMYIGLAISSFASSLIKKNIWTVALGFLCVTLLFHTVILTVCYVMPSYSGFLYPLVRFVIPTAFYDGALAFIISPLAHYLSKEKIRGL